MEIDPVLQTGFKVVSPKECLHLFDGFVQQARNRVLAESMYLEWGEMTQQYIVDPVTQASGRGIDARLYIDSFTNLTTLGHNRVLDAVIWRTRIYPVANLLSQLVLQKGFYSHDLLRSRQAQAVRNEQMLDRLKEAGVNVNFLNPAHRPVEKLMHWRGRRHNKSLIADEVLMLPCFNLGDTDYQRPDLAVVTADPDIVYPVVESLDEVGRGIKGENREVKCNDETSLLWDSGIADQSIISARALELIDRARDQVYFVSQITPDGDIKDALRRAKARGVELDIIAPKWFTLEDPLLRAGNRWKAFTLSLKDFPVTYFPKWVHTKYLIADSNILIGSHAFSKSGIKSGTAEMNLHSKNRGLIDQVLSFHKNLHQFLGYVCVAR